MSDDAERYVSLEELKEELPFRPSAFPEIDDYDATLERFLDEESERIEGDDYAGRTWDSDEVVPGPVKHGIARLVRSRLEQIKSDGIESESLPSGQSATYRPPEEVRRGVRSAVRKYRPEDDNSGAMVI